MGAIVSDAHALQIGRIVQKWAICETYMLFAIIALLKSPIGPGLIVLWHLGYNERRDRWCSLVKTLKMPDTEREEFDCLITRMDAGVRVRNTAAHSVWQKCDDRNRIKPYIIDARRKFKMSGIDIPEFNIKVKEYSPQDLASEAAKIERLAADLIKFVKDRDWLPLELKDEDLESSQPGA